MSDKADPDSTPADQATEDEGNPQPPAPESPRTSFPFRFGRYELLEELGRGAMGIVYRALQTDLDRIVCIKAILSQRLHSSEALQAFQLEARSAARLRHPGIVGVYEAGEFLGQPYIAMEYIEGNTLADDLRSGPMKPAAAAALTSAIARAVAHLHDSEVVHLDLKPSNILLDRESRPYVADFGIARALGRQGRPGTTRPIRGTPSYMAPEQATGDDATIGPCSDVYSLGAILYELLTARPPFLRMDPFDTVVDVIERAPEPPRAHSPELPTPLEEICLQCLEKSPDRRYPGARELADDLDRFLAGDPVDAGGSGWPQRVRRWLSRNPALAYRLLTFASFLGIELVWYHGFGIRDASYHYRVVGIFSLWATGCLALQGLVRSRHRLGHPLCAVLDTAFVTAFLLNSSGVSSHFTVGYFLIVAASGLWFQARLVWFVTTLSLISYGVLIAHSELFRPDRRLGFDRHVVFVATLLAAAFLISAIARRAGALGRHPERFPD